MRSTNNTESEELLKNLVHDLRQPLGTIETSAYYLGLLLHDAHPEARDQIRTIEHQVVRAAALLTEAVAELHRLQASLPEAKVLAAAV
jgi:signal transduction histidine kinase